jgi:thymidylate synthase (FAD)
MKVKLLFACNKKSVEERTKIVATAGKLSRFPGTVTEVYKSSTDYEKNKKFIERVIAMGHDSITDHDYLVFSLENVTPLVEQIIIQERFSSFTIKSRREVDFSKVGFITPDFRDKKYHVLKNNLDLQKKYKKQMHLLFKTYQKLVDLGLKKEDARFVLPYSFNGNIIMGIDAHVLKNWIVKLTKGKESNIAELKDLGTKLYEIMIKYVPYLQETIDNTKIDNYDGVEELLNKYIKDKDYEITPKVKLLSYTKDADKNIILACLMRVYGYDYEKASKIYQSIDSNAELQKSLMKEVIKTVEKKELKQVNFSFQFSISLATLTHYTRHRTHPIMIPDFVPIKDLTKYKTPPTMTDEMKRIYINAFNKNYKLYLEFKEHNVCDEDLIYFYLTGNMLNIETNFDGGTLAHIMRLRICNKAQWEPRQIAYQIRDLVKEKAPILGSALGSDCEIFNTCKEGKESCGKIDILNKGDNNEKR